MKRSEFTDAELKALQDLPDSEIDTGDIPERSDWTGAVRGRFRPGPESVANCIPARRADRASTPLHPPYGCYESEHASSPLRHTYLVLYVSPHGQTASTRDLQTGPVSIPARAYLPTSHPPTLLPSPTPGSQTPSGTAFPKQAAKATDHIALAPIGIAWATW
jgi:hypothetical protein